MMRIHILGASGSGTTTLAKKISEQMNIKHFDSDDYFWQESNPPFQKKREISERQDLMQVDLEHHKHWVLSGSLCGWGDKFIPMFDLVVFLWIPSDIRLARLKSREIERYAEAIDIGGPMHQSHLDFMEWAAQYDEGGLDIRSRERHATWLDQLSVPVLKIEGLYDLESKLSKVLNTLLGTSQEI